MPGTREAMLQMAQIWVKELEQHFVLWNVPSDDIAVLNDCCTDCAAALAEVVDKGRSDDLKSRIKKHFNDLKTQMRYIKKRYLHCPPLTELQLERMGLRPAKKATKIGNPKGLCGGRIIYSLQFMLTVIFEVLGITENDPRADHGFRVHWGVLPPPGANIPDDPTAQYLTKVPTEAVELPHSMFCRRNRQDFVFRQAEAGFTVYFCVRFENAKGGQGPWGPIFSGIIPG